MPAGALSGNEGRDLRRIFGYEEAAAPLAPALVAPDIVCTPFWTPDFCRTLVLAAEAAGALAPAPGDPVPGHEISLGALSPRLFAHVEDDVYSRVFPALLETWPYVEFAGLRDAFVIEYEPEVQDSLPIHHDVAQLSGSVKLNDDYEGGELEFPRQGYSNAAVPVGHLLVWPSLVTHPHRTTPLRRGVKYGLTLWFELPGHEVLR